MPATEHGSSGAAESARHVEKKSIPPQPGHDVTEANALKMLHWMATNAQEDRSLFQTTDGPDNAFSPWGENKRLEAIKAMLDGMDLTPDQEAWVAEMVPNVEKWISKDSWDGDIVTKN